MRSLLKISKTALAVLLVCAILLPPVAGMGEEGSLLKELSGSGAGYAAVLYDNTNGLPTSEANAIVQSKDGFIWIGGYSGLTRYDGNVFMHYDASYGITSVICLFVDSKDRLWIGTNDNGAAMMQDGVIKFYNGAGAMRSSYVRVITEDAAGNILIGTTMGMAYIDANDELHPLNEPQISNEYIDELVPGNSGTVCGATQSGCVFIMRDLRVEAFYTSDDLGYGVINAVCPDPSDPDVLYLGTRNSSVIRADLSKDLRGGRMLSILPHGSVNCVRIIDGLLWVCADNGVGFFQDGSYSPLQNLPMNNSIDGLMEDHEGNLWFTSSRQGVMKIATNRFTDLNLIAHLDSRVVNSTCLDGRDLYIGTDTGLILLNANFETVENAVTEYLTGSRIRCIKRDSNGYIWFCTYGDKALVRYLPSSGEIVSFNEDMGLASNRTRSVLELSDGRIAAATNSGVNIIEDGRVTITLDSSKGISNTQILCLEEGADGRLYMGSDGDGIYVSDGAKVSRIGHDDGLRSEVILRVKRDPIDDELFWVITSNSIAYLKDGRASTIDSFPYNNNFDLYFDSVGRVWVLSSNGIYVTTREDMLDGGQLQYTFYDIDCGLPHITTANSFSCLGQDGTLYIACSTGVTLVDINDTSDIGRDIRLAVPYVTVDDEYVAVKNGEVKIPSTCKRLAIHPFAFTYSLNNPRISYRLEGFDEDSFEVNKRDLGELVYTNLDGGTYKFVLSVINPLTGEATETLTVTIVKQKALGEHWWFWALVSFAVIALVVLVQQLLNRRKAAAMIKKQEEQRRYINGVIKVLSECVEMKDPYTNGHASRVAKYTALLAKKLGKSDAEIDKMYNIAMLHDVGKISIPDAVLNKPERLTNEEYALMKSHAERGGEILKEIDIAPELSLGAGYHHERYDGKGYPKGLNGNDIPEVARIIAVADTFDAMYSTRPYRKRMELSTVVNEIQRSAGSQLDPEVVDAFIKLYKEGAFDNE
ncbi:MAG: HD domain-containing protein [Clostridia bacterium]|nr:HD domain-containing protein [Clostridia bacterium]